MKLLNIVTKDKNAIEIGLQFHNQKENLGKNRSELIDDLNHWIGVPVGSPYCASFISFCLSFTWLTTVKFRSASSQAFKGWGIGIGRFDTNFQKLTNTTAAIAGWTNKGDTAHGHIFLVRGRGITEDGKITHIYTMEGNTSPSTKDRDGEGFYKLKRKLDERNYWFVDLTDLVTPFWSNK